MSESDKNSHTDELLLQLINQLREFRESVEQNLSDIKKQLKGVSQRVAKIDSDVEHHDTHLTYILDKIHETGDFIKDMNEVQASLIVDIYKLKAKNNSPK